MRTAKGDAIAFRQLLERHYDTIYRIAYRFSGMREDAEDITQEISLSLTKKLRSFKGDSRFSTWLYRVVVNAVRDKQRKAGSVRSTQQTYSELRLMQQADEAETACQLAWLYNALDKIGEPLRETAILVLAEQLNHAEAAEILSVKESTISWRMHKLRKKLRTMMELDT